SPGAGRDRVRRLRDPAAALRALAALLRHPLHSGRVLLPPWGAGDPPRGGGPTAPRGRSGGVSALLRRGFRVCCERECPPEITMPSWSGPASAASPSPASSRERSCSSIATRSAACRRP